MVYGPTVPTNAWVLALASQVYGHLLKVVADHLGSVALRNELAPSAVSSSAYSRRHRDVIRCRSRLPPNSRDRSWLCNVRHRGRTRAPGI